MLIGLNYRPREHTEIEEELHDTANIDYDRVAIVRLELSPEFLLVRLD